MHIHVLLLTVIAFCLVPSAVAQKTGPGGPGAPGPAELLPAPDVADRLATPTASFAFAPPPAIAVADGFVYVVCQGVLYQFAVDGLKPIASVSLLPRAARGVRDRPGRARPDRPRPGGAGDAGQQVPVWGARGTSTQ